MKLKFWPYKMGSKSCKALARSLNSLRVYSNRNYRPHSGTDLVINWGNSRYPSWDMSNVNVLNRPEAVRSASNKLSTVQILHDARIGIPKWCTSSQIVNDVLEYPIYCRTLLTSRGGNGIVIANSEEELVNAPLYTQGVSVSREFRVHVFLGAVIDFTEKKRMSTERMEEYGLSRNDLIRNHDNGWVFCRFGVELPDEVGREATRAVQALSLDFGAVDICLDDSGNVVVFEVNTAPGLEGTTLEKYKCAIGGLIDGTV